MRPLLALWIVVAVLFCKSAPTPESVCKQYMRLGVSDNFTRFTDDELVRNRLDNRGVRSRVVGMY